MSTDSPAITALRTRILARFTTLETERTAINTRLTAISPQPRRQHPTRPYWTRLPHLTGLLDHAPAELQQKLYKIFRTKITYHPRNQHITFTATISTGTTRALTTLTSNQTTDTPGTTDAMGQLLHAPMAVVALHSHAGKPDCRVPSVPRAHGRASREGDRGGFISQPRPKDRPHLRGQVPRAGAQVYAFTFG